MSVSFEQAKKLVNTWVRSELRDHVFGDREIFFHDEDGNLVEETYLGDGEPLITVEGTLFKGKEALELLGCGRVGDIDRNDSTGPDTYQDGACMPGLTLAGVRKELTGE